MTTANQHNPEPRTKPSIRDAVLHEITTNNITPKKHWVFLLREIAIWICAVVAVLIGGLGLAAMLHSLSASDIGFYLQGPGPLFRFLSSSLPIIWIIVLLAMILLTRFQIRHAKNGYRYRFVVFLIVLATIIVGLGFHLLHAGRFIERQLALRAPNAVECFVPRHAPWERPEDGVLAGRVLRMESDENSIVVRTPRQDDWIVFTDTAEIQSAEETIRDVLPNQFVKILGATVGTLQFRADTIRIDAFDGSDQNDRKPCRPPRPQGKKQQR